MNSQQTFVLHPFAFDLEVLFSSIRREVRAIDMYNMYNLYNMYYNMFTTMLFLYRNDCVVPL